MRIGQELTLGDVRGAVDKDSYTVGACPVAVIQEDPGVDHEAPLAPSELNLQVQKISEPNRLLLDILGQAVASRESRARVNAFPQTALEAPAAQ